MLITITITDKWKTGFIFKTYKLHGVFSTFVEGVHTETVIEFELPKGDYDRVFVGSVLRVPDRTVVGNFYVCRIDLPNCVEISADVV